MAEACKEAKDGYMILQQSVHLVTYKFLNAVESPIMEACYDILQLPITQSSGKNEFFKTCRSDE